MLFFQEDIDENNKDKFSIDMTWVFKFEIISIVISLSEEICDPLLLILISPIYVEADLKRYYFIQKNIY